MRRSSDTYYASGQAVPGLAPVPRRVTTTSADLSQAVEAAMQQARVGQKAEIVVADRRQLPRVRAAIDLAIARQMFSAADRKLLAITVAGTEAAAAAPGIPAGEPVPAAEPAPDPRDVVRTPEPETVTRADDAVPVIDTPVTPETAASNTAATDAVDIMGSPDPFAP